MPLAGLDRTVEILSEKGRVLADLTDPDHRNRDGRDPRRHSLRRTSAFPTNPTSPSCTESRSTPSPVTVTALVPAQCRCDRGSPQSSPWSAASTRRTRAWSPSTASICQRSGSIATEASLASSYRIHFSSTAAFARTVMFSHPEATEQQFLNACRIARVDEFAERFPEMYETIVGERGVKLSGGQRQRLSIARAILANPRILILDEATSSLDSESEAMIQDGLSYLMQGRTTFVIAHRLSTIRRADQILVVEGGARSSNAGTHETPLQTRRPLLRPLHPPARTRDEPLPRPRRRRCGASGKVSRQPNSRVVIPSAARADTAVSRTPTQHERQPQRLCGQSLSDAP